MLAYLGLTLAGSKCEKGMSCFANDLVVYAKSYSFFSSTWFDVMQTTYIILRTLQKPHLVSLKLAEKLLANFYKPMNSRDDNYSVFINFITTS